MKRWSIFLLIAIFFAGFAIPAYASDWDVAGKVLTGVEGLRIITGGKIDPIGGLIGFMQGGRKDREAHYVCTYENTSRRVWVPHYVWKKKYVPTHVEYTRQGKIIVPGHYVQYRVEAGGYWVTKYDRDERYSRNRH